MTRALSERYGPTWRCTAANITESVVVPRFLSALRLTGDHFEHLQHLGAF